jgi:hypothetical protein
MYRFPMFNLFPIHRLFNVVVACYWLRTVQLLLCQYSLLVEKQNKSYLLMVHYFCCAGIHWIINCSFYRKNNCSVDSSLLLCMMVTGCGYWQIEHLLSGHNITYRIVSYCIVRCSIASYCIVLHCIVLYCIALYCIVLHCIALYCIVS